VACTGEPEPVVTFNPSQAEFTTAEPTSTPAEPPPVPDAEKLAAALAKVPSKDLGTTSIVVLDPDGETLVSQSDKALVPASCVKILTALAALDVLGPQATFTTTVVAPADGEIILVGGGDPFLVSKASKSPAKPALLSDLVDQTVEALQAAGVKKVALGYDDSMFSGPQWAPSWRDEWKPYYAHISALMLDDGLKGKLNAASDPSKYTAEQFAKALKAAGIKVSSIKSRKATGDEPEIAAVSSATLEQILEYTIRWSSNVGAEVVLRHLGAASGQKASFTGGTKALTEWLQANGLWDSKMVMDGGSGLSSKVKVKTSILAKAVALSLSDQRWQAIPAGLPIAGETGTLKKRFDDAKEAAGIGQVHAKTGTLRDVASLAGYLITADGATLTFAMVANKTNRQQTKAYNWLDRSAATIAACGCR
jgi:D-alanyl-D-alanine carboxypeptidase/D-alanyl-D-alanine-endopeptidase (penicillin-binding protein 4)